jgi:N-acetylneuraminic acid mutarotase
MRLHLILISSIALAISACAEAPSATPASTQEASPSAAEAAPVDPTTEPTVELTTPPTDQSGWARRANMITARSEMPAVVMDGLIYVPGGFAPTFESSDRFEVYDPARDEWQSLAPLPQPRDHPMATAHGGRVYVFGGRGAEYANINTWAYDPTSDTWEELALMPEPRVAGAAVVLGDHIYIVGGDGGTSALLRYDPAANTWATLAPLSQPREHNQAVAFDGTIYVLGGRWHTDGDLGSVEIYDPAANRWTAGLSMLNARAGFGAAVLDDRIYVAGGELLGGIVPQALDSVEVYDPATGWSEVDPLPVPVHGLPLAAFDGTLYALGGSVAPGAIQNPGRVFSIRP